VTVAGRLPLWALLAAAVVLGPPRAARADVRTCVDAAEDGQKLRDGGAYRRARARFITCAANDCPGEVRKSCVGWLGELEKLAPTVVFGAQAHGKEVADVRIAVDGEVVAERIDGKPVVLDPGEHHFRFEHPGDGVVQETAVLRAGEKERLVSVQFGPEPPPVVPPPPPSPTPSPPPSETHPSQAAREPRSPVPVYALAALGIASTAAGGALDVSGFVFLKQCDSDPTCGGQHERAEVMWRFLTGDILLGAGALSCLAAWLWWRSGRMAAYRPAPMIGVGGLRGPPSLGVAFVF
jgi:hypothetical protein